MQAHVHNTNKHFREKLRLLCQWPGGEEPCTRGVIEMAGEKQGEAQTVIHTHSWLSSNYTQQPPLPPELQLWPAKLRWSGTCHPSLLLALSLSSTTGGKEESQEHKVKDNV